MPESLRFTWDAEPGAIPQPFSGRSPQTKHASWTGAREAVRTFGYKRSAYMQLLNAGGPLCDQEAAGILQIGLSSVNSTRNGIIDWYFAHGMASPFYYDGFEVHTWRDERGNERHTQRTRFGVKPGAR